MTSPDTEAEQVAELSGADRSDTGQWLTITAAAKAAGVHRSKIRRLLDDERDARKAGGTGPLPNAEQNEKEVWFIPATDLLSAGLSLALDGEHAIDRSNVVDLRDGAPEQTPALPAESPAQALEVLSGFQRSMHALASDLAEATGRAAVAETKLEFVERQRDEERARAAKLESELEVARQPRRRGWFRRRGVESQPAATAGGDGNAAS